MTRETWGKTERDEVEALERSIAAEAAGQAHGAPHRVGQRELTVTADRRPHDRRDGGR